MANRPSVALHARAHQVPWVEAFAEGLRRHGIGVRWLSSPNCDPKADVAVFWSLRHKQIIAAQREHGRDFIVLECPFFGPRAVNAMQMCSAGWNGLNGRADFRNANSPADRWKQHGPMLAEWQPAGEYALIIGQCVGDMSHAHADIGQWYTRMIAEWGEVMPVAFRDHPKAAPYRTSVPKLNGPLADELKRAAIVVTFNSNTGVDALLAGVPVYAEDEGSMVYRVASHRVGQTMFPDRRQWAHDLAYCQWNIDEIASGETWEHLKNGTQQS